MGAVATLPLEMVGDSPDDMEDAVGAAQSVDGIEKDPSAEPMGFKAYA